MADTTKKVVRSAEAIARSKALAAIETKLAKAANKSVAEYRAFLILGADARAEKANVSEHIAAFDAQYPHAAKSKSIVKSSTLQDAIARNDTAMIQKILAKMAEREAKVAANLKKMAADRKAKKASEVKTVAA
jgi:hypothetical protein